MGISLSFLTLYVKLYELVPEIKYTVKDFLPSIWVTSAVSVVDVYTRGVRLAQRGASPLNNLAHLHIPCPDLSNDPTASRSPWVLQKRVTPS
ncbi:hypothetical protein I7I48_06920 [Histoplasma ohiense]|nr:hypothetical protein I7I48_06920 [Histoplasma ohiense (nom. inval.)]